MCEVKETRQLCNKGDRIVILRPRFTADSRPALP